MGTIDHGLSLYYLHKVWNSLCPHEYKGYSKTLTNAMERQNVSVTDQILTILDHMNSGLTAGHWSK